MQPFHNTCPDPGNGESCPSADLEFELAELEWLACLCNDPLELHLAWQRLRRTEAARVGDREVPS